MIRPTLKQGVLALTIVAGAASLAACAEDYGPRPYRYSPYEAGVVARVDHGVIVGARPIEFGPGNNGAGVVIGGVAGGLIGNGVSHGRDRGLATVGGAIAGAVVGNAVANSDRHPGFAYTIQLDRGRVIEVPQPGADPIPNGVRVNVVYEGGRARVIPARGDGYGPPPGDYPPPPPPPPHY